MLFVDPRHGSGVKKSHDLAPVLSSLGLSTCEQVLDSGDVFFLGDGPEGPIRVGIELKLVEDFITSMLSGRLADQLERLTTTYQRTYLIIQGFYRASRRNGMVEVPRGRTWRPLYTGKRPVFWTDVERFLTSVEEAGVRVRRTRTPYETARVIGNVLFAFWSKPYAEHKSLNVLYRPQVFSLTREDEVTRRVRQVAACLPGIGVDRSKAIAKHFGSIYRLINADAEAWATVEGVGKGIAGDVTAAVHAEVPGFSVQGVPAGRVPQERGAADRSARHSRRRQDAGVDAITRARGRVREARRGRRSAR